MTFISNKKVFLTANILQNANNIASCIVINLDSMLFNQNNSIIWFILFLFRNIFYSHTIIWQKHWYAPIDQFNTWNGLKQSITIILWYSLDLALLINESTERLSHRGHRACRPPSTGIWTPVIKEALSDARKAMVLATSSTCPGRPNACVVLHLSRNWKIWFFNVIKISFHFLFLFNLLHFIKSYWASGC